MSKIFNETIELIKKYRGSKEERKVICNIISSNNFKNDEYSSLYRRARRTIDNDKLSKNIIKVIPLKALLELSLFDEDTFNSYYDDEFEEIFKRFEKFDTKKFNLLLFVDNPYIRANAVKVASLSEVLKLALRETNELVQSEILDRLDEEDSLETSDYDMLLNAKSDCIIEYAVEYASLEGLINFVKSEEVSNLYGDTKLAIRDRLENENLTEKQIKEILKSNELRIIYSVLDKLTLDDFNNLLNSSNEDIRAFSVEYASLENVFDLALTEEEDKVIQKILKRLKKEELSQEQIDTLSKAISYEVRIYCIPRISVDTLIDMALVEEHKYVILHLKDRINIRFLLNTAECDQLLNAISPEIRICVLERSSIQAMVNLAIKEDDDKIIKELLVKLKKNDNYLKTSDYNLLLSAKSLDVKEFALEKADIENILELAIEEEDENLCKSIRFRINFNEISDKSIIKKMLYAKSIAIRDYAIDMVDISELVDFIKIEKEFTLIKSATERIKKHKIVESLMI